MLFHAFGVSTFCVRISIGILMKNHRFWHGFYCSYLRRVVFLYQKLYGYRLGFRWKIINFDLVFDAFTFGVSTRQQITAMWTPLTRKRGCGLVVAPLVKARERTAEVARGFESHARRFFGASWWGSDNCEKLTKTTKINANSYFIFRSFGDGENRPRGFLK